MQFQRGGTGLLSIHVLQKKKERPSVIEKPFVDARALIWAPCPSTGTSSRDSTQAPCPSKGTSLNEHVLVSTCCIYNSKYFADFSMVTDYLSLVVYENLSFRALVCVNNVHFSARSLCPGTGTKSELGLSEQKFNNPLKTATNWGSDGPVGILSQE